MIANIIILGLVAMVAIGTIPALAEIDSPLKQYESGVSIQDIQCRDSKILMETQRGTPACVSWETAQKMQQHGWIVMWPAPHDGGAGTAGVPADRETIKIVSGIVDDTRGELVGYSYPQYNLTFPEQVRIGERFEVVLDYTYVIPSKGHYENGTEFADYENPKRGCMEECLMHHKTVGFEFHMGKNAYVELLDDDGLVFHSRVNDTEHRPIRELDRYDMPPVFDVTGPQQKTFEFAIHEPDTEYPFGYIRIDYGGDGQGWIYFYVKPDGTVRLDDEPIEPTVRASGVQVPYLVYYDARDKTLSGSTRTGLDGVDDPEWLLHELATFFGEDGAPDAEDALREANFPDWFIDRMFSLYPDLRTQSSGSSLQSEQPSAASSFSFVTGKVYYYDMDNNRVPLKDS